MKITRDNFEQVKLAREVQRENEEFTWNELSCVNSSMVIRGMPDYYENLDAMIDSLLA